MLQQYRGAPDEARRKTTVMATTLQSASSQAQLVSFVYSKSFYIHLLLSRKQVKRSASLLSVWHVHVPVL